MFNIGRLKVPKKLMDMTSQTLALAHLKFEETRLTESSITCTFLYSKISSIKVTNSFSGQKNTDGFLEPIPVMSKYLKWNSSA
jgi:hypothetical protein